MKIIPLVIPYYLIFSPFLYSSITKTINPSNEFGRKTIEITYSEKEPDFLSGCQKTIIYYGS